MRLLLLLVAHALVGALRCLDNDGEEVDWWFMYKTPGGYNFSYNDPNNDATAPLTIFERRMDDDDNPVAITRTLMSLAEHKDIRRAAYATGNATAKSVETPSYYLYNDQPDSGTASSSYGHTKGVVAAANDHQSGLWIVHSTPHWPNSEGKAKFYFPESEIIFGQTFLCISLNDDDIDAVGQQQLLTRPNLYHQTNFFNEANATVFAVYPNIARVLAGDWKTDPGTRTHDFAVGSWPFHVTFTSLAKNKEWQDDMWENLVADHYKGGFEVESWIRGEALGPYCPPDKPQTVVDVQWLHATGPKGGNVTWKSTQDHAKWGVSVDGSGLNIVCIGDINRMESQRNRGGGAVCWSSRTLWEGMAATVTTADVCKR